jgi:hypothetical protein
MILLISTLMRRPCSILDQKYLETYELYRPVYKVLEKDYSFCCVFKGSFDDLDQIKHKRDELYEFYYEKLKGHIHKPRSSIISFD